MKQLYLSALLVTTLSAFTLFGQSALENSLQSHVFWDYYGPNCGNLHDDPTIPTHLGKVKIPVRLLRITSGGSSPFSDAEINTPFEEVQAIFSSFNIELTQVVLDIVDLESPELFDFEISGTSCTTDADWLLLKESLDDINTAAFYPLNIVFTNTVTTCSNTANLEGVGRFPVNTPPAVVMSNTVSLDRWRSLAHELGHFFGLLHTFNDVENGLLCGKGDLIGDTPAVPNDIGACTEFCVFFSSIPGCGGISNEDGQKAVNNFMSYNGDCRIEFTPFQKRKMFDIVSQNSRPDVCVVPDAPQVNVLGSPTVPLGLSLSFEALLDVENGTNTGNAVSWELVTASTTYQFPYANEFTLTTGIDQIVNTPGTYQICAQDVAPYNFSCKSAKTCIDITVTSATADWHITESGVTNSLYNIYFSNDQTGWIVGSDECILKTTDSGNSWEKVYENGTAVGPSLFGIHFINSSEGWAAGANGTILHTSDGGQNWDEQDSGLSTEDLYSIFFVNSNLGFAAGEYYMLRTTNGGSTWTTIPVNRRLFSVFFLNADTGFFAGDQGALIRTDDGGINFAVVDLSTSVLFRDVNFIDADNGFIMGSSAFFHTNDGGNNWTRENSFIFGANGNSTRTQAFFDANTGYVLGARQLHYTSNGGSSWQTTSLVTLILGTHAIAFNNLGNGFIIGDSGRILRYSPTGTSGADCQYESIFIHGSSDQSVQVSDKIYADNTISTSADVMYKAANAIHLLPGFHAPSGSIFSALLEDCQLSSAKSANESSQVSFAAKRSFDELTFADLNLDVSPNPVRKEAILRYTIPAIDRVSIQLFDINGRLFDVLMNDIMHEKGSWDYRLRVDQLERGLYFVRLKAGTKQLTRKLVVIP